MMRYRWLGIIGLAVVCVVSVLQAAQAEEPLRIFLPLQRNVYQTNETIDVMVIRTSDKNLDEESLTLRLDGDDGSTFDSSFPTPKGRASFAEHLLLNGRALRPGAYTLKASYGGNTAETRLELFSHIRESTFKTVMWSTQVKGPKHIQNNPSGNGFNTVLLNYDRAEIEHLIRAGVDSSSVCFWGGGHQMNLRQECDWSDPYVIVQGAARRSAARGFFERTVPTAFGVHFYDEPGLTWIKDPATGKDTPHYVPSQLRSYESAFGRERPQYTSVNAGNPLAQEQWMDWGRWKLGFLEAAAREGCFALNQVSPRLMPATQGQYGWLAFTDGYYFNVQRPFPVVLGHGGYDGWGGGYFNPSWHLEFSRAHDLDKPCWYMPSWYDRTPDIFRLEQYLAFQTNVQGLMTPPGIDPAAHPGTEMSKAIAESNKVMARLGTIFTTMPPTRPPVAVLYSMSNNLRVQAAGNMDFNYLFDCPAGDALLYTYLAGRLTQRHFMPILDEDLIDGTAAANYKVVIVAGIDALDPEVVTALKDFIAGGGHVLKTGGKFQLEGAIDLDVVAGIPEANKKRGEEIKTNLKSLADRIAAVNSKLAPFQAKLRDKSLSKDEQSAVRGEMKPIEAELKPLTDEKQALQTELHDLTGSTRIRLKAAQPLAKALDAKLEQLGIPRIFKSSEEGISATREATGDIEYLFAVNATHDMAGDSQLGLKGVSTTLEIADDSRPVYDALAGGLAPFEKKNGALSATVNFAPAEMHVYARSARPIGGMKISSASVVMNPVDLQHPLALKVNAELTDANGRVLTGSVPCQVKVTDPHNAIRYDLYRATTDGKLSLSLPLAANDAAGEWKVAVAELLTGNVDSAAFHFAPPSRCGAVAGEHWRASFFEDDRENIYRFFRLYKDLTIVTGTGDENAAAAERLKRIVTPWGVECKVVPASEVNHCRTISAEEQPTVCGLISNRAEHVKAGDAESNKAEIFGFAVRGPVILLGTPENNPLIQHLQKFNFLPYEAKRGVFPGPERGYLAWQREGIGAHQESITLIGYDAAGMNEAVGTLYEILAGLHPLTAWRQPLQHKISPAVK